MDDLAKLVESNDRFLRSIAAGDRRRDARIRLSQPVVLEGKSQLNEKEDLAKPVGVGGGGEGSSEHPWKAGLVATGTPDEFTATISAGWKLFEDMPTLTEVSISNYGLSGYSGTVENGDVLHFELTLDSNADITACSIETISSWAAYTTTGSPSYINLLRLPIASISAGEAIAHLTYNPILLLATFSNGKLGYVYR